MPLLRSLILLIISATLILISYFYIDKPLVWFLYAHHARQITALYWLANGINNTLIPLIFIYFIYYFIRSSFFLPTMFDKKLLIGCNAVVISIFLKDVLKFIFARYWAATFVCNNPSLLENQVYGFNWFKSGVAYTSFPSGHTTAIVAFAASMWFLFPKLRFVWLVMPLLVMFGQISMYYHFVSDVIAGATLGALVGWSASKEIRQ